MSDTTIESWTNGRCKVRIELDDHPSNPRKENDNVGTMVCWHPNYDLGDVNGRKEYGSGEEFLLSLASECTDEDVSEMKMPEVMKIIRAQFILLPLGLYDHSGISMFVGGRGDVASDSAGWDTSNVGYLYCSLKKAQYEWGTEDSKVRGWDGNASFTKAPDGSTRTLREAATLYLKGEVEEYDQYLTGQVYGYIVEAEDGKEDSCWGYLGEIDYVKGEANSSAEWQNERMDKADAQALIEAAKETAEAEDAACRDIVTA